MSLSKPSVGLHSLPEDDFLGDQVPTYNKTRQERSLNIQQLLDQRPVLLDAEYQRKLVYTTKEKQEVIRTIMLDLPLARLYLASNEDSGLTLEVLDGKQKMQSIFDFVDGKFSISFMYLRLFRNDLRKTVDNIHNNAYPGVDVENKFYFFKDLHEDVQNWFLYRYKISVLILHNFSLLERLELFYQINSNGKKLKDSEKLWGRMDLPIIEQLHSPEFKELYAKIDSIKNIRFFDTRRELIKLVSQAYYFVKDNQGNLTIESIIRKKNDPLDKSLIQLLYNDLSDLYNWYIKEDNKPILKGVRYTQWDFSPLAKLFFLHSDIPAFEIFKTFYEVKRKMETKWKKHNELDQRFYVDMFKDNPCVRTINRRVDYLTQILKGKNESDIECPDPVVVVKKPKCVCKKRRRVEA